MKRKFIKKYINETKINLFNQSYIDLNDLLKNNGIEYQKNKFIEEIREQVFLFKFNNYRNEPFIFKVKFIIPRYNPLIEKYRRYEKKYEEYKFIYRDWIEIVILLKKYIDENYGRFIDVDDQSKWELENGNYIKYIIYKPDKYKDRMMEQVKTLTIGALFSLLGSIIINLIK